MTDGKHGIIETCKKNVKFSSATCSCLLKISVCFSYYSRTANFHVRLLFCPHYLNLTTPAPVCWQIWYIFSQAQLVQNIISKCVCLLGTTAGVKIRLGWSEKKNRRLKHFNEKSYSTYIFAFSHVTPKNVSERAEKTEQIIWTEKVALLDSWIWAHARGSHQSTLNHQGRYHPSPIVLFLVLVLVPVDRSSGRCGEWSSVDRSKRSLY